MEVRMKIAISGTEFSYRPGQKVDVSDEIGRAWIKAGHAAPLDPPSKPARKTARAKKRTARK